jgi:predicted ATPase
VAKGVRRPRDGFFLRAESFFNVATEIERLDSEPSSGPPLVNSYGGRSLHEQSHGESFLALLAERFGGQGLYLLDEPEAALSPQRQLAALSRIHDLILDGSQFVMATHSPILMAYPDACIYQLTADGISQVPYDQTEHVQLTRDFLANPERMLRVLLDRDAEEV